MKILLIYRNPTMGHSIGGVFRPIEEALRSYCEVDSHYLPAEGYSPLSLLRNIQSVRRKLRSTHYDIVHITGTENYLLPTLRNHKSILTLHDIESLERGCRGLRRLIKRALFIDTIGLASHVTFISEQSKMETLRRVKIDLRRVSVIHNPVDPHYTLRRREFNAARPTILHIGTAANKNLSRTISALRRVSCRVRIVGRLTDEQREELASAAIDYTAVWDLTDEQMRNEYERCDIVNFPSTYEGFGMPIIEGQTTGRIVITSALEPMRSVGGRGVYLVDPLEVESIRDGYIEIISNHNLRNRIISRGRANAQRYTIERITRDYFEIYERVNNRQSTR
ncbi:MAG: glycosyltransferase [Rikenellaceae bacterium]